MEQSPHRRYLDASTGLASLALCVTETAADLNKAIEKQLVESGTGFTLADRYQEHPILEVSQEGLDSMSPRCFDELLSLRLVAPAPYRPILQIGNPFV